MKLLKRCIAVFAALMMVATVVIAAVRNNVAYSNPAGPATTLTLAGPTGGDTFTITSGTTVIVYDEAGKKKDPQPQWTPDPPFGNEPQDSISLKFTPALSQGEKVVIGTINTQGTNAAPTGTFSTPL